MTRIPDRQKPTTNIARNRELLIGDLEPDGDRNSVASLSTKNLDLVISTRSKLIWFVMPTLLLSLFAIGASAYSVIRKNSQKQLDIQSQNQVLLASKTTGDLLKETLKFPEI